MPKQYLINPGDGFTVDQVGIVSPDKIPYRSTQVPFDRITNGGTFGFPYYTTFYTPFGPKSEIVFVTAFHSTVYSLAHELEKATSLTIGNDYGKVQWWRQGDLYLQGQVGVVARWRIPYLSLKDVQENVNKVDVALIRITDEESELDPAATTQSASAINPLWQIYHYTWQLSQRYQENLKLTPQLLRQYLTEYQSDTRKLPLYPHSLAQISEKVEGRFVIKRSYQSGYSIGYIKDYKTLYVTGRACQRDITNEPDPFSQPNVIIKDGIYWIPDMVPYYYTNAIIVETAKDDQGRWLGNGQLERDAGSAVFDLLTGELYGIAVDMQGGSTTNLPKNNHRWVVMNVYDVLKALELPAP